jgi:hypothetical protein
VRGATSAQSVGLEKSAHQTPALFGVLRNEHRLLWPNRASLERARPVLASSRSSEHRRLLAGCQRTCKQLARLKPAFIADRCWLRDVSRLTLGLPRLGTELLLFHHGQTGYFHVRHVCVELCQSSSVVVLEVGSTYRYRGPDRQTVLCPRRILPRLRPGRMTFGVPAGRPKWGENVGMRERGD